MFFFFIVRPFNPFRSNYFISQRLLAEEATLVLRGAASIHWGSLPYLMRVRLRLTLHPAGH